MTKKIICLVFSAAICGSLCACGHNAVVFGKGFGFRAGLDPEHFSADFSIIYGEQLTLACRDNIQIKLKTDVSGGSETATASTSADSILEIAIGPQINGYLVEAVEAGVTPDHIKALKSAQPTSD